MLPPSPATASRASRRSSAGRGRIGGLGEADARLGYTRYVAQGGDVGAAVTDAMGRQAPEGLIGIHTNLLVPGLAADELQRKTERGTSGCRERALNSGGTASLTSSR